MKYCLSVMLTCVCLIALLFMPAILQADDNAQLQPGVSSTAPDQQLAEVQIADNTVIASRSVVRQSGPTPVADTQASIIQEARQSRTTTITKTYDQCRRKRERQVTVTKQATCNCGCNKPGCRCGRG